MAKCFIFRILVRLTVLKHFERGNTFLKKPYRNRVNHCGVSQHCFLTDNIALLDYWQTFCISILKMTQKKSNTYLNGTCVVPSFWPKFHSVIILSTAICLHTYINQTAVPYGCRAATRILRQSLSSNGCHSGTIFFKPEKNFEFFRLKNKFVP